MKIVVVEHAGDVSVLLARRIADSVRQVPTTVIGLPAGQTPIGAYAELRRLSTAGLVDFSRVSTFNLDEFVGISGDHPGSFRQFMERHFFSGVNIDPSRIHFLNGAAERADAECRRYDEAIARCGGIDLQILGIGGNGHIGFNEPADALRAGTHRVALSEPTRRDNAALFGGDANAVPAEALTMGIGSIMCARRIVLAATGTRKAACVERMVRGPVTTWLPASLLQLHQDVEVVLDRAASATLQKP